MLRFALLVGLLMATGCNLTATGQKMIDANIQKHVVPALQSATDSLKRTSDGQSRGEEHYVSSSYFGPAAEIDLDVAADHGPAKATTDHPEDVLTIKVCQLRPDGVAISCASHKVVRKNWPSFWQQQGGAGTYLNGQPMRKFETIGIQRYSERGDQISINIVQPKQAQAATCNCGCNGQCNGTCFCGDCTCAKAQSAGCASCGSAGGERQGFMQRGPVRRFFANRWFPGKRVFRFFGRRGCSGC